MRRIVYHPMQAKRLRRRVKASMNGLARSSEPLYLHAGWLWSMPLDVDVLVILVRDDVDHTVFDQADDGIGLLWSREPKGAPAVEVARLEITVERGLKYLILIQILPRSN